jgi:HrpA-like RNA helicase
VDARKELPIYLHKEAIVESIKKYQTTILVGETGTGKSTQLPQYLSEHFATSGKCVVCTQPRRVAAVTIAQKVASEQGTNIGERVGYSIRFEDKCSSQTRIKFVTDGVLLRECMSDPNLSKYSVVILDEAHERSLQTDILMGLLRNLQERREDLRIVVMSATLQTELFSNFFKVSNCWKLYSLSLWHSATISICIHS